MKTTLGLKRPRQMARAGIFLFALVLVAGTISCPLCNGVDDGHPPAATEISTWVQLNNIRNNLSGHYLLVNNLHSGMADYSDLAGSGANGKRAGSRLAPMMSHLRGRSMGGVIR